MPQRTRSAAERPWWTRGLWPLLLALVVAGCAAPNPTPTAPPPTPARLQPTLPAGPTATPRPLGTLVVPTQAPTVAPSPSARPVGPQVGNLAPNFTLEDLDGNSVSLEDLRGRPVLLNFWATWCPPCRVELPDLIEVHQAYQEQNLTIVAINFMESEEKVRQFMEAAEAPFLVLLDSDARAVYAYGVRGLPTSFFIDEEGVIVSRYLGPMTREMLDRHLANLLDLEEK